MGAGWGTRTEHACLLPHQGPRARVRAPRGAKQSSWRGPGGRTGRTRVAQGEASEGRVGVLTASPKACSISLWSLSPGPICLLAKSSCLGRRRSRRREAPAPPLSPPPLLLSRPRGAQQGPAPPARRRPPPTPQPRRSPQALAHVCMVVVTVPCRAGEGQPRFRLLFWSRFPG